MKSDVTGYIRIS